MSSCQKKYICVNKVNPKSKLMTFLGYPQGTKGYLFMRGPNNVLFTAVQALFDETLFVRTSGNYASFHSQQLSSG